MTYTVGDLAAFLNNLRPGTAGSTHLAELLVGILRHYDVDPEKTFQAAAGRDYGFVSAWDLGEDNGYAVEYGNNGETGYDLAYSANNLGAHLLHDDLNGLDALIERANIYGAANVLESAAETAIGPFSLICSRDYYGPRETVDVVRDDQNEPLTYDSWDEARAEMDRLDGEVYSTAHNESGRPTYYIVELN